MNIFWVALKVFLDYKVGKESEGTMRSNQEFKIVSTKKIKWTIIFFRRVMQRQAGRKGRGDIFIAFYQLWCPSYSTMSVAAEEGKREFQTIK